MIRSLKTGNRAWLECVYVGRAAGSIIMGGAWGGSVLPPP